MSMYMNLFRDYFMNCHETELLGCGSRYVCNVTPIQAKIFSPKI